MFSLFRLCRNDEISFDIVAENGNNVEATFDFVERTKFNDKLVRHCCRLWQQSRMLLRQCCLLLRYCCWCRSSDSLRGSIHTSNNVEATFDFVEATSDFDEATFDFVAIYGNNDERFYCKISSFRQSRMLLRHCCWCGRGFTVSCCEVGDNQPHRDKRCCWLLMINAPDMSSRAAVNDKSGAVSLQSLQSRVYKCLCLRIFLGTVAICSGSTRRCTTTDKVRACTKRQEDTTSTAFDENWLLLDT